MNSHDHAEARELMSTMGVSEARDTLADLDGEAVATDLYAAHLANDVARMKAIVSASTPASVTEALWVLLRNAPPPFTFHAPDLPDLIRDAVVIARWEAAHPHIEPDWNAGVDHDALRLARARAAVVRHRAEWMRRWVKAGTPGAIPDALRNRLYNDDCWNDLSDGEREHLRRLHDEFTAWSAISDQEAAR